MGKIASLVGSEHPSQLHLYCLDGNFDQSIRKALGLCCTSHFSRQIETIVSLGLVEEAD